MQFHMFDLIVLSERLLISVHLKTDREKISYNSIHNVKEFAQIKGRHQNS